MIRLNALKRRVFSIQNSFLLYRDLSCRDSFAKGECEFRLMKDDCSLWDTHSFENSEYYAPIYSDMIKNGNSVIFGYLPDNRCVYRVCVQRKGSIYKDGCLVKKLNDNEGYVHFGYCDPEYRGKGLFNKSLSFVNNYFSDIKLYAIVSTDNVPSLRGVYRNGYTNCNTLRQINILGFRKLIIKETKGD
jgi:RimJ/RimL family protein N-acetyltransferase